MIIYSIFMFLSIFIDSDEEKNDFMSLYDKYNLRIYNYIYRNVSNKEIAEDLVSNTFYKALNNIHKKKPKIKKFKSWIYKIATNEVLLYHRYRGYRKNNVDMDDEDKGLHHVLTDEKNTDIDTLTDFWAVKKAMKELKPKQARLIELRFFENFEYFEISKVLNMTETNIRSTLHRTLKKLKSILDDN